MGEFQEVKISKNLTRENFEKSKLVKTCVCNSKWLIRAKSNKVEQLLAETRNLHKLAPTVAK